MSVVHKRVAPQKSTTSIPPEVRNKHGPGAVTGGKSYKHLVGKDGSVKSVVRKGDDVIDAATLGPRRGKRMRIASGRHMGLDCKVAEVDTGGHEGALLRFEWLRYVFVYQVDTRQEHCD